MSWPRSSLALRRRGAQLGSTWSPLSETAAADRGQPAHARKYWTLGERTEPTLYLTGALRALAMLLAALGVYGLVAFNVAQRTAEIGVRKVSAHTRSRWYGWFCPRT